MNESIYLNFDKVLSYNAFLTMLIADRGVGKTFGAKTYCINHYLKKRNPSLDVSPKKSVT